VNGGRVLGHILALISVLVWGMTFLCTKLLLEHFSPVGILIYRFILAYVVLFAVYPRIRFYSLRTEIHLALLGITGVSLYFFTENAALMYSQASNVSLVVATAPVCTALLAHLFTKDEKLARNIVIGAAVALTGISLVVYDGAFHLKISPLGDILALGAACMWAFYSILLKKRNPDVHPVVVVRKTFLYGVLTALPALAVFPSALEVKGEIGAGEVINMIFLGVVASAVCYFIWNKAIDRIGIVKTSSYIYLIPLIGMLSSVLVLDEKVGIVLGIGAVFILLGVYISENGFTLPWNGKRRGDNRSPDADE